MAKVMISLNCFAVKPVFFLQFLQLKRKNLPKNVREKKIVKEKRRWHKSLNAKGKRNVIFSAVNSYATR